VRRSGTAQQGTAALGNRCQKIREKGVVAHVGRADPVRAELLHGFKAAARIMEYQRAWQVNRDGFAPVVSAL
jgi:hypothetical protein